MCLFWAKNNMDALLWNKHEGDGKQLSPGQSMLSGGLAAILGPCATGPFDVIKTRLMAQVTVTAWTAAWDWAPGKEAARPFHLPAKQNLMPHAIDQALLDWQGWKLACVGRPAGRAV